MKRQKVKRRGPAKTQSDHDQAVRQVMKAIEQAGLILNPEKCHFGKTEINFWGLLIGEKGVKPDPGKVEALHHITPPNSKEELISFLCMMQSNADFIPNFSQKSSNLREMTRACINFKWDQDHQKEFDYLIQAFRKDTLLRYFDMGKQ